MGAPETEIVVSGEVKSVEDGRATIEVVASQGENQTIRNAEAEVRTLTALRMEPMLSERQELILRLVVDAYLASGKPVASKPIAEEAEVEWGASTVRAELAGLEAAGYLTHPHTSAGRVPTEVGYRCYVDRLIESGTPQPAGAELSCRACGARSTRRCARRPWRSPR